MALSIGSKHQRSSLRTQSFDIISILGLSNSTSPHFYLRDERILTAETVVPLASPKVPLCQGFLQMLESYECDLTPFKVR